MPADLIDRIEALRWNLSNTVRVPKCYLCGSTDCWWVPVVGYHLCDGCWQEVRRNAAGCYHPTADGRDADG